MRTGWQREDYFEELNETINGIVYFADKSSLKPKGMGTIRLKMPIPWFLIEECSLSSTVAEKPAVLGADSTARPFHPHVWWNRRNKKVLWQPSHHDWIRRWEAAKAKGFRTMPTSLSMEKVICHQVYCGMQDLVIWIITVFVCWERMVYLVCPPFPKRRANVMHVY